MNRKEHNRKYYLAHKEKILARNKIYAQRHKEEITVKHRGADLKFRRTPKGYYKVLKRNALTRGLYALSQEDFLSWYAKQRKVCVYCDIPEDSLSGEFTSAKGHLITRLTVDRKDNNRGYEEDNMALSCYRCNQTKGDFFNYLEMKNLAQDYIKPKWQISHA